VSEQVNNDFYRKGIIIFYYFKALENTKSVLKINCENREWSDHQSGQYLGRPSTAKVH